MARSNAVKLVDEYFKLDSIDKDLRKELIGYTIYLTAGQTVTKAKAYQLKKKLELAVTYLNDGANDSALRIIRECQTLINNL
jgi:hypothetical protein